MVSPIRHLLNQFFSFIYHWVRPNPDSGRRPLPKPKTAPCAPTIDERAMPDPAGFGVTDWRNPYRSGDYVGRSLWLDEWAVAQQAKSPTKCISRGHRP